MPTYTFAASVYCSLSVTAENENEALWIAIDTAPKEWVQENGLHDVILIDVEHDGKQESDDADDE